ncbi:MAG: DNA polymerase [Mollicutes bacterium UO1]
MHKVDIKSCHGQIMRKYPLPYGEPTHIKEPEEISKQLKEGKSGFIRFYLKNGARIKNNQIPFIPDFNSQIKSEIKGRMLLHTRLFDTFCKQYKIIKPIIYTDF